MGKWVARHQIAGMNVISLRKLILISMQIFDFAVRNQLIGSNPVAATERPRDQRHGNQRPKIRVLDPVEARKLLAEVAKDGQKHHTIVMLALFSGGRQDELFGLKLIDIYFDNKQIVVQRTFNDGLMMEPKTHTSKRRVDIGAAMLTTLKKWRLACPISAQDLVFPNNAGGPMDAVAWMRRHFRPAVKRAGLGHVRFPDLRHTAASMLLNQGESVKYVQTILGHSSPVTTLSVYSHLMRPTNEEAPRRLEASILGDGPTI